jgi:hypothetical protein
MLSQSQPWAMLLIATICLSFLWNATESFLYYRNMKRRLTLDLADPETTHRFLLWGLASGCSVLSLSSILFIRGTGQVILAAFPMTIIALLHALLLSTSHRRRLSKKNLSNRSPVSND